MSTSCVNCGLSSIVDVIDILSFDVTVFLLFSGFAKNSVTLLVLGSLLSFFVLFCASASFFSSFSFCSLLFESVEVVLLFFRVVVVAKGFAVVKIPGGSFVNLLR